MNKNYPKIALAVLAIALFLWWLMRRPADQMAQPTNPTAASQSNLSPGPAVQRSSNTPAVAASDPTPESDPAAWAEKRRKEMDEDRQRALEQWRTPIAFYGRVLDELGNPVPDVAIEFVCNDISKEGTTYYHTTSDGTGSFALTGVLGKGMSVHLSKQGYYVSKQDNDSFEYGDPYNHFAPDAANPVIFHLKKKGTAEPLIRITGLGLRTMRDFLLTPDGRPVNISLKDGNSKPEGKGDLEVEFWASPPQPGSRQFAWRCRISVPGGGILPTVEQFPFLAPESGYLQADEYAPDPASNQWTDRYERTFFIRQGDGEYARVRVRVHASSNQPYFGIESYLNPSGSRNLEFDPNNVASGGN
jgi:hypothetical protein